MEPRWLGPITVLSLTDLRDIDAPDTDYPPIGWYSSAVATRPPPLSRTSTIVAATVASVGPIVVAYVADTVPHGPGVRVFMACLAIASGAAITGVSCAVVNQWRFASMLFVTTVGILAPLVLLGLRWQH